MARRRGMFKKYISRRIDGRVEWHCEHGVGHTVAVPGARGENRAYWIHGCDGCCIGKVAEYEAKFSREMTVGERGHPNPQTPLEAEPPES